MADRAVRINGIQPVRAPREPDSSRDFKNLRSEKTKSPACKVAHSDSFRAEKDSNISHGGGAVMGFVLVGPYNEFKCSRFLGGNGLGWQASGGPYVAGTQTVDKPKDVTSTQHKLKRPSFFVVVVHNDPFTPRHFVVAVLKRYFDKNEDEAIRIMMLAHNFGVGVVAKFSRDIAEAKAQQVNEFARESGYPLFFSVEDE